MEEEEREEGGAKTTGQGGRDKAKRCSWSDEMVSRLHQLAQGGQKSWREVAITLNQEFGCELTGVACSSKYSKTLVIQHRDLSSDRHSESGKASADSNLMDVSHSESAGGSARGADGAEPQNIL